MKKAYLDISLNTIKRHFNYSEEKLEIITYGLEVLYITITKTVVILLLAYIFGLFKPLILLLAFYTMLRLTAFGLHAKTSAQCWISSIIIFLGLPYLISILELSRGFLLTFSIIGVGLIAIYAPCDTEKRPIVSKKRRMVYKVISTITAMVYTVMLVYSKNNLISNALCFSIILQVVMILPITYKIFNLSYNNYKKYLANG